MYLWRGVYWSEQVSFRTRVLLMLDWVKRGIWGRDLSKVSRFSRFEDLRSGLIIVTSTVLRRVVFLCSSLFLCNLDLRASVSNLTRSRTAGDVASTRA